MSNVATTIIAQTVVSTVTTSATRAEADSFSNHRNCRDTLISMCQCATKQEVTGTQICMEAGSSTHEKVNRHRSRHAFREILAAQDTFKVVSAYLPLCLLSVFAICVRVTSPGFCVWCSPFCNCSVCVWSVLDDTFTP
jgi:hypothetical protein